MSVRSDLPEIMDATFCSVVERVAFMFGDGVPVDALEPPEPPLIHTSMTFKGPVCGSLALTLPLGMGSDLAANALGAEPGDTVSEEQAIDAVNELLNVTCGQIVTALAGEKPAFRLTVPQAQVLDEDVWETYCAMPNTQGYAVDDYPVLLQLVVAG